MPQEVYVMPAARLWSNEEPWPGPIAILQLDDQIGEGRPLEISLPSCPLVGVGDPAHPLASVCDTIIEGPVGLAPLIGGVERNPLAASVTVQLLRLLPSLDPVCGLDAESMAYALLQGSAEHAAWLETRAPAPIVREEGAVRAERSGDSLTVTLDRPTAGNAIDRSMRDGLFEAFALAAADPSILLVRLRGQGPTFCLGAELAEFGTTRDPATAHDLRARTLPARQILRCAERLTAWVDGPCIGAGLEMAAFARRVEATPRTWFQLPELAMGILPGAGGCVSLVRRIGRQRTALLILSGRRLGARKALEWGLVDAIVDEIAADDRRADVVAD